MRTHHKLALAFLASLPLLGLVLLSFVCDAQAQRDLAKVRYCVIDNTSQHRVLIRNCIAVGRCQNRMGALRRSVDDTKVIIKWSTEDGPPDVIPEALMGACSAVLTHAEAHALVRTREWSDQ